MVAVSSESQDEQQIGQSYWQHITFWIMLTAYHITKISYSIVFRGVSPAVLLPTLRSAPLEGVLPASTNPRRLAVDSPIPFRSADGASEAEAGDVSASTPAESKYAPKSWDGFKWDGCLLKIRNYVYICVFMCFLGHCGS